MYDAMVCVLMYESRATKTLDITIGILLHVNRSLQSVIQSLHYGCARNPQVRDL